MTKKTRVLVVDDSALVRSLLTEIINRQPDMECAGAASDPLIAREMIRSVNPDVVTLDIEMPRMDGLDFLGRLMRLRPMPVLMVSTLTERGAEVTMRALELGAIDFVAKPRVGVADGLRQLGLEITEKIRIAARARVQRLPNAAAPAAAAAASGSGSVPISTPSAAQAASSRHAPLDDAAQHPASAPSRSQAPAAREPAAGGAAVLGRIGTEKIIFIGASTGGTEATRALLMALPADCPAVMITQHMPPGFTRSYAARLDSQTRLSVAEARDGERVLPGHAYIAPGGMHLAVERSGANYIARVTDGDPVNRHKPSVEVLFDSAAHCVGRNALGVMLTGMGGDGARAMRAMRDAGSFNICQDEATCVVFGMPREAIAAGAADEVLPLPQIAPRLLERLRATAGGITSRV